MAQFIRFNLFPLLVRVKSPTDEILAEYPTTRTIVTDDEVIVYVDSSEGPRIAYQERIDDFEGNAKIGWTVHVSDGNTVTVDRTSGCGCGSRLRGLNPFPGVPFIGNT